MLEGNVIQIASNLSIKDGGHYSTRMEEGICRKLLIVHDGSSMEY